MFKSLNTADSTNAMQERLARHYGSVMQGIQSPSIATTDVDSNGNGGDPSWNEALTRAMTKSTALVEAQANIVQRESEVAQREQELKQRERALQAEKARLQAQLMFPALKIA